MSPDGLTRNNRRTAGTGGEPGTAGGRRGAVATACMGHFPLGTAGPLVLHCR